MQRVTYDRLNVQVSTTDSSVHTLANCSEKKMAHVQGRHKDDTNHAKP